MNTGVAVRSEHHADLQPVRPFVRTEPLSRVRLAAEWRRRGLTNGRTLSALVRSGAAQHSGTPVRFWADEHLIHAPVEINTAAQRDLLRVPGIGIKGAARIMNARRKNKIRELNELQAIGITNTPRVAPYVLLDGRRPMQQPRLF